LQPLTIRFDGQVVLVTGAGRGLGRAHALLLAERGAHVVVHDAGVAMDGTGGDPGVADAVVAEIAERGGSASPAYQHLSSREACRALVEEAGRLDAVVHNAGILRRAGLEDLTPESWDEHLRVHVEAPLWISQASWPAMKERGYGRFVVTVSGHGLFPTDATDLAAYSVCKGAAFGLMNVLAEEGAPFGILGNAVSPAAATRMWSGERRSDEPRPEQVAAGVVYLASSACNVSGLVLRARSGRFSAARYGGGEGVDLGDEPTPEDVAAAWADIDRPVL
jgi:NAD(P)-dependent dehydrogenase (short-subunit alcohol dehydrogenase family)